MINKKRFTQRYGLILMVLGLIILLKALQWFNNKEPHSTFEPYRNIENVIYTKHAKCRMKCRDITVPEIEDIIQTGQLNMKKSGLGSQGDSTFALEGYSKDRQHIRVVVAPKHNTLTVITCIDLDEEWQCDCN